MTVVSIVFAILLMTLRRLASMQFSPRILVSFVKDRVTQWMLGIFLGIFLGTFAYCVAALPAARSCRSPSAGRHRHRRHAAGADLRGLAHLLHPAHLAGDQRQSHRRPDRETEDVIDDIMLGPAARHSGQIGRRAVRRRRARGRGRECCFRLHPLCRHRAPARARQGFQAAGAHVRRRVGHCAGGRRAVLRVAAGAARPGRVSELLAAFDIGPTRTLQQDVEFGVIQIVDIALKAISPAVNDPSTAITWIDQLGVHPDPVVGRKLSVSLLSRPLYVVRAIVLDRDRGPARYRLRADPRRRGVADRRQPASARARRHCIDLLDDAASSRR